MSLATLAAAYGGAAIVFLVLDILWLSTIARGFYQAEIGALLRDRVKFGPAALFYFFYIAGIVGFTVVPALGADSWLWALVAGTGLGLLAYGTYDMSNLATLRGWSLKLSLVDMVWGGALTGVAAVAGFGTAQLPF